MTKSILLSFALMLAIAISEAQTTIPNAGFESWTSMGAYENPDGWDQVNALTSGAGVYTCEKGTPGNAGTAYLKLTSKTVSPLGVIPGVAVCGLIDLATMQPKSGFPFTGLPQSLTGKWQHMIFGTSQGFIDVKLTRWDTSTNTRKVVAVGHVDLTGMAMSWENFTVSLSYNETSTPDSCIIAMLSSGPTGATDGDYLWVDGLAFTGSVAGINQANVTNSLSVFPNPSSTNLTINLSSINDKKVTISVFDILGKELMQLENVVPTATTKIDLNNLTKGNYILNVVSKQTLLTGRFTKE